jgi:hypothetical protein
MTNIKLSYRRSLTLLCRFHYDGPTERKTKIRYSRVSHVELLIRYAKGGQSHFLTVVVGTVGGPAVLAAKGWFRRGAEEKGNDEMDEGFESEPFNGAFRLLISAANVLTRESQNRKAGRCCPDRG